MVVFLLAACLNVMAAGAEPSGCMTAFSIGSACDLCHRLSGITDRKKKIRRALLAAYLFHSGLTKLGDYSDYSVITTEVR